MTFRNYDLCADDMYLSVVTEPDQYGVYKPEGTRKLSKKMKTRRLYEEGLIDLSEE